MAPDEDLAGLYADLKAPLERIVVASTGAPLPIVEDACQFAWSQLVKWQETVSLEHVLGWLVRTATRDGVRRVRAVARELSLESAVETGDPCLLELSAPGPEELFEHRERLDAVRGLPERQQRLVWLRGLGLSPAEAAAHERCTPRTVERQLIRARRSLLIRAPAAV